MDIGLMESGLMNFGTLLAATSEASLAQTLSGWGMTLLAWLGVAAGLTFVIFVHELGHFLVAKACGVKCEKFYVGFDFFEIPIPFTGWKIPRSLIKFQYGETEYGLGSLPLGGYVKMLGQDDDPRNAESEAERIRMSATADAEKPSSAAPAGDPPGEPPVPAKTVEGQTVLLDPRSYPAKPVLARMAIISAGVIMNLIFAVILAAIAFRIGVRETPATIGTVAPGSPAWTAGVLPGSRILKIGTGGAPFDHLRFDDLRSAVILNGADRELPFLIRRPDGQTAVYEIRPSERLKKITKQPSIGITPERSREIAVRSKLPDHLQPASSAPLENKDRVIAAAGHVLATDSDLTAIMAQYPRESLNLTIERGQAAKPDEAAPAPQRLEVTLEARPMREIGASMRMGPIVAIRKGSPAADSDFRVGDIIVEMNGAPVGDPLALPQQLVPTSPLPEPITFLVSRSGQQGAPQQKTITITPEKPRQFHNEYPLGGPASIESLGIAYEVSPTVSSVAPGSGAAEAGLRAGDAITQVEFIPAGEEQREIESKLVHPDMQKPIVLDDNMKNWPAIFTRMQDSLPDTKVKLTWTRDGQTESGIATLRDSETHFDETRGLALYTSSEVLSAATFGEALRLGYREATERVKQVVLTIQSLVTRRVSPSNLSGPAGIIVAAGSFASEGFPMLLIFLTILSANLAVLNFLPIPALDGGHMLFLAAEGIRGKPVDERLQIRLTILGVICLLSLMVYATAMDINRFAEMIQRLF